MKFIDLGLDQRILDGIDAMGYETATPVQQQVMVPILEGKDIIAAAQTGTGSTFVMNTSPTLVTPVLGVATATSINGTTIPSSKTLVATDSTAFVVPSQTGNSGKFLTTNGTTSSFAALPAGGADEQLIVMQAL